MKPILDPCCGSRAFWFDKNNSDVLFCDQRQETRMVTDKSSPNGQREISVNPDKINDFRKMHFDDESFYLVVFDPPHLTSCSKKSWLHARYGRLETTWREDIADGFAECFRVLKDNGTLVFKWSETDITVSEILKLTPEVPLFGHKSGKRSQTHWITFMKRADK